MNELEQITSQLNQIIERNRSVEAQKAWETSGFRIASICVITYIVASIAMYFIGVDEYWLSALIPTLGYYLSTQSLPAIKKRWINNYLKMNKKSF